MAQTPTINPIISGWACQTYKVMDQITSVTIFYTILIDLDTTCGYF